MNKINLQEKNKQSKGNNETENKNRQKNTVKNKFLPLVSAALIAVSVATTSQCGSDKEEVPVYQTSVIDAGNTSDNDAVDVLNDASSSKDAGSVDADKVKRTCEKVDLDKQLTTNEGSSFSIKLEKDETKIDVIAIYVSDKSSDAKDASYVTLRFDGKIVEDLNEGDTKEVILSSNQFSSVKVTLTVCEIATFNNEKLVTFQVDKGKIEPAANNSDQ